MGRDGAGYRFHDVRKDGVPAERLATWVTQLGWEVLVNRRGTTWRQLDVQAQQQVADAASAQQLVTRLPN